MHSRLLISFLSAFCFFCRLPAQSDSVFLSVDRLFGDGMSASLVVGADRIKEKIASEDVKSARSCMYPDFEISINAGVLGQPVIFMSGLDNPSYPECPDWSQNYAVNFTQPLYTGGRIKNNISKSELEKKIAVFATASDMAEIKLALLEKYLSLLNQYRRHEVFSHSIEESEQRLVDIRRMKREGIITENDVLRCEIQLTDNRLLLNETENNIAILSQQISLIIGMDSDVLIVPDTILPEVEKMEWSYDDYILLASDCEPGLQIAHLRTLIAGHELKIEKSEYLPHLSFYASNTLARPVSRTLADMYNNNWNFGLSFSCALSSVYSIRHKVNSARLNIALNRNIEEQRLQTVKMEIRKAYLRHHEALEKVSALELSVKQSYENYRIMRNRYMNHLAILTDLLDADNIRMNAELQLTNAKTNVVYTYYQLKKACGKL